MQSVCFFKCDSFGKRQWSNLIYWQKHDRVFSRQDSKIRITGKIINTYDRFIPHKLLELLGKKDIAKIELRDNVEKRITILFSDIRDSTTLSE